MLALILFAQIHSFMSRMDYINGMILLSLQSFHIVNPSIECRESMCCLSNKKEGFVFSGGIKFSNWTLMTKRLGEEMVSRREHNDVDKLKKTLITKGLFQRIRNCCAIHNQKKRSRVIQFRYLCFNPFDAV